MFDKRSDAGYQPALDGIERKTLVHGDRTLMTEFLLHKGAVLPRHAHPHEQTGYLVRGSIRLSIGTEEYEAQAGDSWCVPSGVEHGARSLEDSLAIEVFSPIREDYLPARTQAKAWRDWSDCFSAAFVRFVVAPRIPASELRLLNSALGIECQFRVLNRMSPLPARP